MPDDVSTITSASSSVGGSPNPGRGSERGGRGRYRRGGGYAGRGGWGGGVRTPRQNPPRDKMGKCEALGGHVYDVRSARHTTDQYTETTREIIEHIGSTYKFSGDVVRTLTDLASPKMELPKELDGSATAGQKRRFEKQCDEIVKQEHELERNLETAYLLIWGQCWPGIRQKLHARDDFADVKKALNAVGLLELLKATMMQVETNQKPAESVFEALWRFANLIQAKKMSNQA